MNPLWKSWLKKKDLTDKEWEKQKKINEKKRKEQMGKDEKKHSQEQRDQDDQDKIDRERGFPTDDEYNTNTCPTCGHNTMDDDPPSQDDDDDLGEDGDDYEREHGAD